MESASPHRLLESPDTLRWLTALVCDEPALSRSRLARQVCVRLGWRDAMGRAREMACRKRLLVLERRGAIVLPPARRARPVPRPMPPAPGPWPEVVAPLAALGTIALRPVSAGSPDSRRWNEMMRAHHPLGPGPLCGAQLRYFIESERPGQPPLTLGGLAVSAAAWRLGARDTFLGWTDAGRAANLQGVVCNSRFLILPSVRVRQLASHVLGRLARQIGPDWRDRYGYAPWLMETCVEATRPGTVYRAANWIEVGMTAGRGRQDTQGEAGLARKRVFLYPLSRAAMNRHCPNRVQTPPPGWIRREFAGANLGDRRLDTRLFDLAGAFFARPGANIPQACGSAAAAKAAYRFFDHDKVTMDALLEPHHQATIARMRREPVVLVAQDTTSLRYTTRPEMQGIGPISNKVDGPQGLFVHSAQAFRPDGLPLGVLDIETWARDPAEFGKRADCNAKPIEDKESNKWLRALIPIGAAAAACPGTRVVTLADREADIYEYLLEAGAKQLDTVTRVREKSRALDGEVQQLWPYMALRPKAGTVELQVPRHGRRAARTATLSISFDAVTLKPPANKKALPTLPMWIVLAREQNPPAGVEALEWMLLTSVAVAGLVDALERIRWYAVRWGIEVFHRILKSGCQIEDRQLGSADRLEACLAIDAVVAWRIHHLTYLGRATPDLPATAVFDDDQWKAVIVFTTRKRPPAKPPSLREMIRMIGRLGGFLGRKSDGEPGSETLWRGLQRMDDIAEAFKGFISAYKPVP